MSPAPVSVLMCALLLCGPLQEEDTPSPCPASETPAPRTAEDPEPCATPSASPSVSPPSEAPGEAVRRSVAAPSPVDEPVAYRTAAASAPAVTAFHVIGNISTGILVLLCAVVLVLRLSVGWPRFPTPYLGQRRRGSDR